MFKLNQFTRLNSNAAILKRLKNTLVIVEHDNKSLAAVSLNTITAATKIPKNEKVTCIVVGNGCSKVAEEAARISGVNKVLVVDSPALNGYLPEM